MLLTFLDSNIYFFKAHNSTFHFMSEPISGGLSIKCIPGACFAVFCIIDMFDIFPGAFDTRSDKVFFKSCPC